MERILKKMAGRTAKNAPVFRQRRRLLQVALAAALAPGLASALERGAPPKGSGLDLGNLPLLEGGSLRGLSMRGQVVVVYWWASWCPFCARQSPEMQALHQSQAGKGLMVLGVAVDETKEAAREHAQKHGFGFTSAWLSPEIRASLPWVPTGVPAVWVYDRDSHLVQSESGTMSTASIRDLGRWV